jgi:membrane-associated phospholipid phosphatase
MSDTESTAIDTSFQLRFARWISIIGHPFLLMPLLTGIIAYRVLPPIEALIAELVALSVVIIPAGIYTIVRVRKGTWTDLDVSHKTERGQFYAILLPLLVILALITWIAEVPRSIPRGVLAIIALVGSAYVINIWTKISLHTGFAVFVALTLFLIHPILAIVAVVLAMLVAWSRVVLGRHTRREVLFGGVLGCAVGGTFVATLRYLPN